MKFCEKLQKLRKEKGYSQEQLADLLDVSRQSVSKWESGTTYPEMDKLLSLCKIFNVSLDELTNDEITDKNIMDKKKNNFSNIFYAILDMINKSIEMFKNMSKKELAKCITELIILFVILLVLKIPFNYINASVRDIFINFSPKAFDILNSIWLFLSNVIYLILFVTIFIFVYKSRFLDKYNGVAKVKEKVNKEENEGKIEVIKDEVKITEKAEKHSFVIFDVLGRLFTIFIKICLFFILMLVLLFFIILVIGTTLSLIAEFIGIHFIGIFITLLGATVVLGIITELLIRFLLSSTIPFKRMFWVFMSSIVVFGIGCATATYEFTRVEYIDELPINAKLENEEYVFDMQDNLVVSIGGYYDLEYVVDDTLTDQIKVNVEYYEDYLSMNVEIFNKYLNAYNYVPWNKTMNYLDLLKDDLKDKVLYNYDDLSYVSITITTSSSNIETLKNNTILEQNKYEEEMEQESYYINEINRLEEENYNKDETISELEDKIAELEERLNDISSLVE